MMNYLNVCFIFLASYILSIQFLYAQESYSPTFTKVLLESDVFEPIEADTVFGAVIDALDLGNNKIAYYTSVSCSSNSQKMHILDLNTHNKIECELPTTDSGFGFSITKLLKRNDNILWVGQIVSEDYMNPNRVPVVMVWNQSLQLQDIITLEVQDTIRIIFDCIINNDGNLVVISDLSDISPNYFVAKYDSLWNLIEWSFVPTYENIVQLADNSYRIGSNPIYVLNPDLQLVDTLVMSFNTCTPTPDKGLFKSNDSMKFYFTGNCSCGGIAFPLVRYNITEIADDGSFTITPIDTLQPYYANPVKNFSFVYDDYKYTALDLVLCDYPCANLINSCVTDIMIYCINNEAQVPWQIEITGDVYLRLMKVMATPDSGVLVFANRFIGMDLDKKPDAYYLKLDKYGNPQPGYLDTYTSLEPAPTPEALSLRYDAAEQALYLPPHLTGGSYRLYHINGALLESFTATGHRIALDKWPPGLYLYDYTAPDGQRYRGKVVK